VPAVGPPQAACRSPPPSAPTRSPTGPATRCAPGVDGGLGDPIAHYQGRFPERSNFEILLTVESEAFRVRSLRLADDKARGGTAPVFTYLFRRTASKLAHGGAYHGLEMGFVFDNLHTMRFTLADEGSEQLAHEMSGRWAAFARTGRPDVDPAVVARVRVSGRNRGHATVMTTLPIF
jgi:hypothetical protein